MAGDCRNPVALYNVLWNDKSNRDKALMVRSETKPQKGGAKNHLCYCHMTKKDNQLTLEQGYKIEALVSAGNTQTAIAKIIGVHSSIICREFKRNVPGRGRGAGLRVASKPDAKTKQRHLSKVKLIKLTPEMKKQASGWVADRRLIRELLSA